MPDKKGLMTANKLIKALLYEFMNNKEYVILREIKKKKSVLDQLIKENKAGTPEALELRARILDADTGKILANLEQQIPRIQRISGILKKIKQRGKTSEDLKAQLDMLIYLFDFIVAALAQAGKRNLAWLDKQQKEALKANNHKQFSELFAEENKLCSRFDQLAQKLDMAGIADTLKKPTAKKTGWFKKIVLAGMALLMIGTAGLFTSAGMQIFERQRDPLENVIKVYLAEDPLTETSEEKELETLYGFNIIGDFTKRDLALLKQMLEKHHSPAEIRMYGLKTIVILGGEYRQKAEYEARIGPGGHELRLFSKSLTNNTNFEHEVAHARHYWLIKSKSDFNAKWQAVAGKYDKVGFMGRAAGYRYKAQPSTLGMLYGYVKPYGGTDMYEDVATFVEVIRCGKTGLFSTITSNFDVYRNKIKLLQQYGFISREEARNALAQIDIAQKRNLGMISELNLGPPGAPENQAKIVKAAFEKFQKKQHQEFFTMTQLLESQGYIKTRFKGAISYIKGMVYFYSEKLPSNPETASIIKKYKDFANEKEIRWQFAKEAFKEARAMGNIVKDSDLVAKAQAFLDHIEGKTPDAPTEYPSIIKSAFAQR